MTFTPVWAVDGGRVDAAAARRQAWVATKGASGITSPLDLRVYALAVPGAAVNIRTGGGVVESTYATAGACESYAFANNATYQLPVPGGLPSSTTYYVIARVDDWHFNQSSPPADPLTATYVRPDLVTSGALASVTDPYIRLAKIVLPANTATVTSAMITDLRTVATPRSDRAMVIRPAHAGDTGLALNESMPAGENFPDIGLSDIDVPSWATRMQLIANWDSVNYGPGNSWGYYWVNWGPVTSGTARQYASEQWAFDTTGANQNSRIGWRLAAEVPVAAAIRGTSTRFALRAGYAVGSTAKSVSLTASSGVSLEVVFLERADQDVDILT